MKLTNNTNENTKNESKKLRELCALWTQESKKGDNYLSGKLSKELGGRDVVGFFNTSKNAKEPSVRICAKDEDGKLVEICALWDTVSKNTKLVYLYGKTNEDEKVIGFYDKTATKTPFIKVYFKD